MSNHDIRIVKLEPLRVAAVHGFGPEPEGIAWEKMTAFVAENNLTGVRYFGFNHPNPAPGSPNYGYEQWVTVGPEVEASGDGEIKVFDGGVYAVMRCQGVENIPGAWQELVAWAENSPYQRGNHQWLEEVLTPPPTPFEEFILDLYLPIVDNPVPR